MPINILFDTGALQGNYLSEDVAGWMRRQGAVAKADRSRVCGAFNECHLTNNLFSCQLRFSSLDKTSVVLDVDNRSFKPVDAEHKRKAECKACSTSACRCIAKLDLSRAKRRRLGKLSALAAFKMLNEDTSETPEGTSRTETLDQAHAPRQCLGTSETPEGTSRNLSEHSEAKTEVVSVEIDARELETPYDMIIGRPSICKHKLLQFDAQLCVA